MYLGVDVVVARPSLPGGSWPLLLCRSICEFHIHAAGYGSTISSSLLLLDDLQLEVMDGDIWDAVHILVHA